MSTNPGSLRASCGFRITPTAGLIDILQLDYLAIVGDSRIAAYPIDHRLINYLKAAEHAGVPILILGVDAWLARQLNGPSLSRRRDFVDVLATSDTSDGMSIQEAAWMAARVVERHLGPGPARLALQRMKMDRPADDVSALLSYHPSRENQYVRAALLLMTQNIREPFSVDRIALRLGISRRHLERLFHRHIGKSPGITYRDLRLSRAFEMLLSSKRLLSIAQETGFSGNADFRGAFRRRYGCAPSEQRNRLRRAQSCEVLKSRSGSGGRRS